MEIKEHYNLRPYNTFGLSAITRYFVEVKDTKEVQKLVLTDFYKSQPEILILGGGSNILITRDFPGLVVKNSITFINIIRETEEHVWLKVGAGESWHDLVLFAIENNYGGIENLSLIPGTVGAAPMQNIGAYGVEIKEVFEHLEAVNISSGEIESFDNTSCQFGYRDSIFKREAKGKYIITNVTLKLSKRNHSLNTTYGAITTILEERGIKSPTIKDVSQSVIAIRQSKLPNPAEIGNAGSFFKNPVITSEEFNELAKQYPEIPHYEQHDGIKVPAGWLIEKCGWKGQRRGSIGVHKLQALVLVNYGEGSGADLKELSDDIRTSVKEKFGVELETEVNFI